MVAALALAVEQVVYINKIGASAALVIKLVVRLVLYELRKPHKRVFTHFAASVGRFVHGKGAKLRKYSLRGSVAAEIVQLQIKRDKAGVAGLYQ